AYTPSGPLARFANINFSDGDEGDGSGGASNDASSTDTRFDVETDLEPELWYNRVDQLHAGLGGKLTLNNRVQLGANVGYSTGLDEDNPWSYGGNVRLRLGARGQAFVA